VVCAIATGFQARKVESTGYYTESAEFSNATFNRALVKPVQFGVLFCRLSLENISLYFLLFYSVEDAFGNQEAEAAYLA
jgi:hypothetical protein